MSFDVKKVANDVGSKRSQAVRLRERKLGQTGSGAGSTRVSSDQSSSDTVVAGAIGSRWIEVGRVERPDQDRSSTWTEAVA